MVQKMYLRQINANSPPTTGEKSTALPVGTFKDGTPDASQGGVPEGRRALTAAHGSLETGQSVLSLAQTGHQDDYLARFTLDNLAAQTFGSGTWTFAFQATENNAAANTFLHLSIYVWRPSNSSVVGFIYDSEDVLGVEWGNGVAATRYGQVITITGANVTCVAGDVLVLEVWTHATQGGASARTNTIFFDGTTDVVATATGTDAASYLSAPADIATLPYKAPYLKDIGGQYGFSASPASPQIPTANLVAGDLVIVHCTTKAASTLGVPAGEGWVALTEASIGGFIDAVFAKIWGIAGNSDDSTPSFTNDDGAIVTNGWGFTLLVIGNPSPIPWTSVTDAIRAQNQQAIAANATATAPAASFEGAHVTVLRLFSSSDDNALNAATEGVCMYGGVDYDLTAGTTDFAQGGSMLYDATLASTTGTAAMTESVNGTDTNAGRTLVVQATPWETLGPIKARVR